VHGPMMPPYKLQRIWHTSMSFLELRQREVRRIPILRTPVNRSGLPYLRAKDSGYVVPCKLGTVGG
jgi:hypothetical protein